MYKLKFEQLNQKDLIKEIDMVQSMSTAQHSTAQHSTAQHSTAQHSTTQHNTTQHYVISSVFCQPLKKAFSHFGEKAFLCENGSEVAYA